MVSYDPSCPRTFHIAKSTPGRKKNCDKAIDGDLQSPKLGPEHALPLAGCGTSPRSQSCSGFSYKT